MKTSYDVVTDFEPVILLPGNSHVGDGRAGDDRGAVNLTYDIPSADQQTPAALAALQKAEIEKWWPIIKAAKITGN